MNVPVPPIYLNEDNYGQYSVIDGRQRLTTVAEFISNSFPLSSLEIFGDINGLYFRELPARLQAVLKTRPTLRAVIILRQSDADVKYEVFHRLNTGGVSLNAQEVRNSVFVGTFNSAIVKTSEERLFQRMLGITPQNQRSSRLYQEMGDVELVLRYFTFRENWRSFGGGITRTLDAFMDDNKQLPEDEIKELQNEFIATIQVVHKCFGDYPYRRWRPDAGAWRNSILASAFDIQMLALREFSLAEVTPVAEQIQEAYKLLFVEDEFQRALRASVAHYFIQRIQMFQDRIISILGH